METANELKRLIEQREGLRSREAENAAALAEAERELAAAKYELEVAVSEIDQARETLRDIETETSRRRMLV